MILTSCPMCLGHLRSVSVFLIGDDARTVHNIYHPPVRTTHLLISAGPRKRSLPQHPTQQVYCGKNAPWFTITVATTGATDDSVSIAVDSVLGADRGILPILQELNVFKFEKYHLFNVFIGCCFFGRILNSSLDGVFIKCDMTL